MDMTEQFKITVEPTTYRHFLNGFPVVLHCHHYLTLYTKAAEQFAEVDGPRILAESMEDAVRPILDKLFADAPSAEPAARLEAGARLYAYMGLGAMTAAGEADGGTVTLRSSHLDQGWIKKWGKRDKPVNYVTKGFIAALFAAAFNREPRSYASAEVEAIVSGAAQSVFVVKTA